ncbi:hypothetical protein NQ317_015954 [Molorchus minor]|uniref:Tetratricopeptide repeat protein 37 n=1 Tax=Molorchus minor TaxID=1323400 RepID=A0ABQ9JKG9_9CUCU|nr:hypothetical protein NQ317_015954 [Molorchus minor]
MTDKKTMLKEAREAIKKKDYEMSLKLSKSVLKEDKTNYMALVFLGLSLQEVGPTDQAPKAFRKAIECNSENPLAWTGLINYYEKLDTDDARKELIKLYSKAVDIESEEKKIIEYCGKLAKLYDDTNIIEICTIIYKCSKNKKIGSSTSAVFEILYERSLLNLIQDETVSNSSYYSSYLAILYKQKRYEEILVHAEKMHNLFESDTISLVWICKVFNQLFIEESEIAEIFYDKVMIYSSKLLEMEQKNAIALFSKSIILLKENKVVEAKAILVEVTSLRPGLLHAWVLLAMVSLKLNLFEEASRSSLVADKLLQSIDYSNKTLKQMVDLISVEILSKTSVEEDWNRAVEIYSNFEDSDVKNKCLEFIIRIKINLESFAEAKLLLSDLKCVQEPLYKLLLAKLLNKQKKYKEALALLEDDPVDISEWWLEIGLSHWSVQEYKECLVPFLKVIITKKVEEFDKARRCYEKAFKINPTSPEIGTELSKIYRKLKNWEAIQNLLHNLTTDSINKHNAWAWLQLGLTYLEQEDFSKAIENLRLFLRMEEENVLGIAGRHWQSILWKGFIYLSFEMLSKVFGIGKKFSIFISSGCKYKKENGQYVPALKGLAETCMCLARECYRDQRLGTARDQAQSAVDKLTVSYCKAINLIDDNVLIWHDLGTCYLHHALNTEESSKIEQLLIYAAAAAQHCAIAILAEKLGHEEAMDLFRHSTQLGQQQQGGLGYGHWVCRTLLESPPDTILYSIHNMHAIPVASDALTWYIATPRLRLRRARGQHFLGYLEYSNQGSVDSTTTWEVLLTIMSLPILSNKLAPLTVCEDN